MQTRLTLRHETNARPASICVRNELAIHRGLAHPRLLRALPAIRVAQHELDVRLDRVPERGAVRVGVRDERAGAVVQVA